MFQFGVELKSLVLTRLHLAQTDLIVHTVRYVCVFSNRNDLMTFETSIDKLSMHIRAVYVSGQPDLGLCISPTECIMSVWILHFKVAEIQFSLRFSHLNSIHFTFEERDFWVSVVAQTRTNVRYPFEVFFGQLVYLSAVKWRGLLHKKTVD